jgi:hypothetical protein
MTENTEVTTAVATATETVSAVEHSVATVAADILGGTDVTAATETETQTTAPVAETPGKAARQRNGEKREYTPRGTTYWARRVILLNGEPVGRGRPAKDGKGERKVVYVPVGMEYDVAVHGEGVKYNTHSHRATHKRIAKDSVSYTFDDGVAPAKATATKAKTKAKTKATKTTKVGKGKGKGKTGKAKSAKKSKSNAVTVPVADVAAPVDPAPAVEIPAATDAVTA